MWALFIILNFVGGVLGDRSARFSNIKCDVLDPSYCAYEQCRLKILGRGVVALNVHAKLLKGPFNNAKVNLSLWRKYSGFRPFMFNETLDFCKFVDNANEKLTFANIFYHAIHKHSNLNHSCPYGHDIVVHNLIFKKEYFKYLPLPSGEYQFKLMAATDREWKTTIYTNLLLEEDL